MFIAAEVMDQHTKSQAEKTAMRTAKIDALVEEAKKSNAVTDRNYWMMVYDFEMSPKTTNRKQLLELGIEMPAFESVPCPNQRLEILKSVTLGLSLYSVYLIHLDCYSDDEVYKKLEQVIDEEIREVVGTDIRELVSFGDCSDPDTDAPQTRDWLPVPPKMEAKNPQR